MREYYWYLLGRAAFIGVLAFAGWLSQRKWRWIPHRHNDWISVSGYKHPCSICGREPQVQYVTCESCGRDDIAEHTMYKGACVRCSQVRQLQEHNRDALSDMNSNYVRLLLWERYPEYSGTLEKAVREL